MNMDKNNTAHDIEDLKKTLHTELMKQFGNISMDEIYTIIKSVRPDLNNVSLDELIESTVKKTQEEIRNPVHYSKSKVFNRSITVETNIYENIELNIIVFKISGNYKIGSEGNGDGAYISGEKGMKEIFKRIKETKYNGLIVDMEELSYSWGDGLSIFQLEFFKNVIPVAYVAGERCIEGLNSLKKLVSGIDNEVKLFTNTNEATEYINNCR
jgi:hypothetical protein